MSSIAKRCRLLTSPIILLAGVMVWASAASGVSPTDMALRQEYNAVSARIDSIVRAMSAIDPEALDASRLPDSPEDGLIPEGARLVFIFWADDEARVWLNDFLVGETRLTPVEIEVPALYLRTSNRIRVRCWDTDWVESGFLCGLYLKASDGQLQPVVVSDDSWSSPTGTVQQITYAHSLPDIPGAHVIWQTRIFGKVELEKTFDAQAVSQAAARVESYSQPSGGENRGPMDYHAFVQSLAQLQERREQLSRDLSQHAGNLSSTPVYGGTGGRSLSLTLGKAGPLKEGTSRPVSENVRKWAKALPDEHQVLLYPERRTLKGEDASNPAFGQATPTSGDIGERTRDYRPPEDRSTSPPGQGSDQAAKGDGKGGALGTGGSGGTAGISGPAGGAGGRASRLGLLLPTLVLSAYVGYVISKWQQLTGGG